MEVAMDGSDDVNKNFIEQKDESNSNECDRKFSTTSMMRFERSRLYRESNTSKMILQNIQLYSNGKNRRRHSSAVRQILSKKLSEIRFERLTLRQIFARYVESSTLHGFRYVCSDTFFIRRFIWACLMISGFFYFLYKFNEGVAEYLSFPFSTLSTTEYVKTLQFPAISFCLLNNLNFTKVKNSPLKILYESRRLPINSNWTKTNINISGKDLHLSLMNASFSIQNIFEECDWLKKMTNNPNLPPIPCNANNFTNYVNAKGERCFTINGDSINPLIVNQNGLLHGLELLLTLQTDYALINYPLAGLQIIVHDQNKPPGKSNGFFASAGETTYVSITRTESLNLPPPYATKCGEIKLKYYKEYNQKACFLERLTDIVAKLCKCREPFMPENGLKICSLQEKIDCSFPTQAQHNEYELREQCPVDCHSVEYKTKISSVRFIHNPPKGIEPVQIQGLRAYKNYSKESIILKKYKKLSKEELDSFIEENLVQIMFFFEEMIIEKKEQEARLDFYRFLGDMGGEIGLLLGASLLTCFEFVDLILFLAYNQLLRIKKDKLRTPSPETPTTLLSP